MTEDARTADRRTARGRPAWRAVWAVVQPRSRKRERAGRWTFPLIAGLAAIVGGILLGLALTVAALRNGETIGAVAVGPWRLPVGEGTVAINPYQRAVLARTGAVPMNTGQGVAFTASRDSAGQRLDRHCRYSVSGSLPRARFWTLAVTGRNGYAIPNPADRFAFSSSEILRDETGAFSIVLAPTAMPGNWLPLAGPRSFVLVLRLYDSAVPGFGSREFAALMLPTITRTECS